MGIQNWLSEMFGWDGHGHMADSDINPATGLPVSGGMDILETRWGRTSASTTTIMA